MYTLYYLNRNLQLGTIKVPHLNERVLIPEDLVFCNLRKGINFIKEPDACIAFTDTERLIMNSEFTDMELLKQFDYRRQNTYLDIMCQVDMDFPYVDPDALPYIVAFSGGKLHFNMPMPAGGIYELETSYDNGVTWDRIFYYTAHDETLEIPGNPGYFIEDKLTGASDYAGCNNSLLFSYEDETQKLRVKKDGIVVSQPMF